MYRTLSETFPVVHVVPTYDLSTGIILGEINVILFATKDGPRLSRAELVARAGRAGGKLVPASELAQFASHLMEIPVEVGNVPTLTDDFAPVEILRAGL
jgi:hypothetical protein